MTRIADRPYRHGDFLPPVGSTVHVSGVNADLTCAQDRYYGERIVIGYTPCGNFVCLQTENCWPTVEKLTNCWFGAVTRSPDDNARAWAEQSWLLQHKDKIHKLAMAICEVNAEKHSGAGAIRLPCGNCTSAAFAFFLDMTRKEIPNFNLKETK